MQSRRAAVVSRPSRKPIRPRLAVAALLLVAGMPPPAGAASWTHPHADAANTGFVDVVTAPAALPDHRIEGIGEYAPGAGPVVAADGTVYLGNLQGQLRALRPDGTLKWMRDTPGRRIVAPPAIGADGAIYVVGTITARDHRGGDDVVLRHDTTLYRFNRFGAMEWARPFPAGGAGTDGSGSAYAAPNIWRPGRSPESGGGEVIMVPVLHRQFGYELHLVAFSASGGLVADHTVTTWSFGDITGSGASFTDIFCTLVPLCFNRMFGLEETVPLPGPNELPDDARPPHPAVGMFASGGGDPVVVVADNHQNIVGYRYAPAQGFQELFRKHLTNDQIAMSAPALLRDGHSVIRGNGARQAWVLFGGPAVVNWTEVAIPMSGATPTLTAGGRIVMIDRDGGVTAIATAPTRGVVASVDLAAESIAPAAASCSHVYVSTVSAMVTLDAEATDAVARFDWRGGGLSAPAIGPDGSVYALAGDSLHIFAPPPRSRFGRLADAAIGRGSCRGGPVIGPADQPTDGPVLFRDRAPR